MFKGSFYLYILAAIFIVVPLFMGLITLYTDWLFFNETGFSSVFTKTLTTKVLTGLAFGLFFLLFSLTNILYANKIRFPEREFYDFEGLVYPMRIGSLERLIRPLSVIVALLLAFFTAQWGAMRWEEALLLVNSIDMGLKDPILGRDVSFYMFKLPIVESIKGFAGFTLVTTIVIVGAIYLLKGGILFTGGFFSVASIVKVHLGLLIGFYIVLSGIGFYIDTFNLLLSSQGIASGPGYTSINARLPFLRVLTVMTIVAGILFITGIFKRSVKLSFMPLFAVVVVYIIGLVAYPSLLQKLKVAPNELVLETPYIEHNIRFTRKGYDLDKIETIPFDVNYTLSARDIQKNDATIKNIRLWDHAPLLRTYSQLQQIRTYYKFADVDNDRYVINGEYMQVMLSPRELSYSDLPSKSWINERLIFTHGNGITLGPVSKISREGLPEFIIKDIPPISSADIKITRPEIYYGELSNDYVIVKTKVPEFSYPTSTDNIYTTYSGKGGVPIDSILRRILFSIRFGSEKVLLSTDITNESRILYNRNISERVRKVAPFLRFDKDPYLVISRDGRLKWIIDGYTISGRMPYSKPQSRHINYIRNSVKALIDAYDGTVAFYISDPTDTVIKVYSRAFPELFRPLRDMPEDLRAHIRYPQMFLQIQASMFAAYHMTDPKVFYNKENLWEIPTFNQKPMEPYYTIMKLPGGKQEEYILLLPYVPAKRDNLAAWLAARCDGENYGKIIAYTFPRDRLIYGPKQIEARINQDAYISQQLTLWNQRGSEVIMGSLLVIPIESSLLYVQPLYLAASDKVGLPELRRVIVSYENDLVMEENLEIALNRLFGGKKSAITPAEKTLTIEPKASPAELSKEALRAYERAIEMQRQGNWAGYGDEIKRLEQILRRLAK
jgi:uncharacterized membrane protein (UPF0182 family)